MKFDQITDGFHARINYCVFYFNENETETIFIFLLLLHQEFGLIKRILYVIGVSVDNDMIIYLTHIFMYK